MPKYQSITNKYSITKFYMQLMFSREKKFDRQFKDICYDFCALCILI